MKLGARVLVVLLVVAVIVVAGVLWLGRDEGGWTSSSTEAALEFDRAIEASHKLYSREALAHLEKAVELDPNFVLAKASLAAALAGRDSDRSKQLWDEVKKADLGRLTDRERFMVKLSLARLDRDPERMEQIINKYGAQHPNDPFVLYAQAQSAWQRGDIREAEPLYRRVIKVAPNWVVAYNELGYMAMGEGKFKQAEDLFVTYRFIAPDQANPHDSLGELFLLTGRYEEARKELELAIEVKPDFCASYEHLMQVDLLDGRNDEAMSVVERARASQACPEQAVDYLRCTASVCSLANLGKWEAVWEAFNKGCEGDMGLLSWAGTAAIQAAAATGRWDEVEGLLERLRALKAKVTGVPLSRDGLYAQISFTKALLCIRDKDNEGAIEGLLEADRSLGYYGSMAMFKLIIRLHLVDLYRKLGRDQAADRLLADVERVNPKLVKKFREQHQCCVPDL